MLPILTVGCSITTPGAPAVTQPQPVAAPASVTEFTCCVSWQGSPACRALWLKNLLGVSSEFLCPYRFSLGTLLPKLIGLQCPRDRMLVVTGKMVISYSIKWNKP